MTVLRFLDGHKHLNFVTLEIEPPNSIKLCVFFENMADFSVYFRCFSTRTALVSGSHSPSTVAVDASIDTTCMVAHRFFVVSMSLGAVLTKPVTFNA